MIVERKGMRKNDNRKKDKEGEREVEWKEKSKKLSLKDSKNKKEI